MNIAEFCIRRKTVTVAVAVAMFVAGVASYFNLGRLEDPEFTIKNAQIVTMYPGATASEVAEQVTDPIETAVQQLGQLKRVTSTSYPGKSIVMVEMKDRYGKDDLPQIWDELRRKVNDMASALPQGCSRPMVLDDYGDVYGVFYAIYGDGYSYAELKEHAKLLRRELLLCDDVAKIDLVGDLQEVVYFELPRARMASLGISPAMIENVLRGQNTASDSGHVEIGDKYVRIHPGGKIRTVEDFGELMLTVRDDDGGSSTVRLRDVIDIRRGYQEPPGTVVRYNGRNAIGLGISTVKGGNVMTMGDSIDRRMRELLPQTPIGIEVGVISHQASSVDAAVSGFVVNLVESVIIVIAVLLFTMGLRSGVLIGAVLVLTVMATVMVMDWVGVLFERISLGAFIIALGMLVDNAIVITEAVLVAAQRRERRIPAAIDVVKRTQWPLLGATVIAVLSFAPIGASQDATGEFCRSLFLVLLISLMLSWVFAITVTPLFAAKFLVPGSPAAGRQPTAAPPDPYGGAFYRGYRAFLVFCITHRYLAWAVLLGLLFASIMGFRHVKQNFFPESTRPQYMVHVWMPEGTAIDATEKRAEAMAEAVKSFEGVTGVTTITGGGGLRFLLTYAPEDPSSAYAILFVDVTSSKIIDGLMEKTDEIAHEVAPDALVYSQKFVLGPGDPQKIQFRLIGPDPAILRAASERALEIMRADGGLKEIQCDWRNRVDLIVPEVAEHRARKLGVTREDVSRALKSATEGVTVGSYLERDETLPIVMRAPEAERTGFDALRDVWTWSSNLGCPVPVAQAVNRFRNVSEEARLKRRNRLACLTVKCNAKEGTAAEARLRVRDALEKLGDSLPVGCRWEWGGEYESSQNANKGLSGMIPPIAAMMILVVVMLFNSFRQTVVIFMTVPLIIVGVVAGLLGFGEPFGFMALLGFLSLVGMQIKNAIVLMDEIKAQLAAGVKPFEALVMSGVTRLRPVANAALTTVLGMMPLVADAFYSAMAVTVMCGLAFATVLTMVVIPVNYALLYNIGRDGGPKKDGR